MYGILDKNAMETISIANKILQDPIRFYEILDKYAIESMSIGNKILEEPTRFYGILHKNAMESISIPNNVLKILRDTRKKCSGIHRNSKQDPTRFYNIRAKILWNS